jgi:cell division protein ZipA
MKYVMLAILLVVVAIVIIYFVFRRLKASNTDIVFVPAGLSQERITKLGLRQSPQQDLEILRVSEIRFPDKKEINGDGNYRALPAIHWIVDIYPPKGFIFRKAKFLEVFDYDWRSKYPSQFYAHFPSTDKWSFAIAGDSPDEFDSLELAIELAGVFDENELSADRLESYLSELNHKLKKFETKFEVVPRESLKDACIRSAQLKMLQRELKSEIIVVLKSDGHFKSIEFWNTLVDVGLKWGDGDLFHWENYESHIGDHHFFDVWTSSDPGYFLPEEVAVNKFKPKDLIFGFSIPRSGDPEKVFEMMSEAIAYCQKRLEGVLLDQNGNPFDKEQYKRAIQQTISRMKEHGLELGQGLTLRLF